MTHVEELTAALEELMADKDSGPSDWATALVDQGWIKKNLAHVKIEPGMPVEVMVRGDWVPGRITAKEPGGLLDIAHERGSVSVYAKGAMVRLPEKKS